MRDRTRTLTTAPFLAAIAFAAAAQPGCVPVMDYFVSAPVAVPLPLQGKVYESGEGTFSLVGLEMGLAALDDLPKPEEARRRAAGNGAPPFLLLVWFDPEAGGYAFDPAKAAVRTADGRRLPPSAFVGPGTFLRGDAWNGVPRGCFPREGYNSSVDLPRLTESQRYAVVRRVCFVLAFDLSVDTGVEVAIDGLERNGEAVPLPSIRFLRRSARSQVVPQRPPALLGSPGT
jgi:hypothetical protein